MNWRFKALLQRAFSAIPHGESLNHFCQRHMTRNYPLRQEKVNRQVSLARQHLAAFMACGSADIPQATFYEFGAGWTMLSPLAYYCCGVNRQELVDIRRLLKPNLINDVIGKLDVTAKHERLPRRPAWQLASHPQKAIRQLQEHYGIAYRAPADARNTALPAASVDFITSTSTLEHIPPGDIRTILRECRRILRSDGAMSFCIDYQDHFSYFDRRISAYNFLQYSDDSWGKYNSALHYQNRLRHREYLQLFADEGFDVAVDRHPEPTDGDLDVIRMMRVHPRFGQYSLRELAVRQSHVVLRKRPAAEVAPQSWRSGERCLQVA
jgi:SAM-dependent methyltransferase